MLFGPPTSGGKAAKPWVRLLDSSTDRKFSEQQYFQHLLNLFNQRNPHALVEALDEGEQDGAEAGPDE